MSLVDEIMETYFYLNQVKIPNDLTPLEKRNFYNKHRAQAKRVKDAYQARGQPIDDIFQDLAKLDYEAKSKHFSYAIDTLNRYTFQT